MANAHLVKTRHIRLLKDEVIKQCNQDEQQRLEFLSLSTKDETLDQNTLKFNVGNIFSLNSSSFPEILSTKSSISSSVLSSCSHFPSAEDKAQVDEMLPDISELRERSTPVQLERLQHVLLKNQGSLLRARVI